MFPEVSATGIITFLELSVVKTDGSYVGMGFGRNQNGPKYKMEIHTGLFNLSTVVADSNIWGIEDCSRWLFFVDIKNRWNRLLIRPRELWNPKVKWAGLSATELQRIETHRLRADYKLYLNFPLVVKIP